MNERFRFLKNLVWMTQLGLSIAAPLVLCILGAVWLRDRFGWGGWVVALGILIGLGAAVSSLWSSFKSIQRQAGEEDKGDPGVSFNDHK